MPLLTAKNLPKSGENQEKLERKGKNRESSFTLPLLTDRAGYATEFKVTVHYGLWAKTIQL